MTTRHEAGAAKAVVITGVGIAIPGLAEAADLLGPEAPDGGFDPATGLKGRAMRHKDRASRLALRAVGPALRQAGLLSADGETYTGPGDTTAVVISSNLGNLDSVCDFVETITEHTVTGLSPLGLPHTSSNVIAGWIAIRYGMRGPNLTVCNGATSGADALYWARNLLAVRRAETVVVIGVEPHTEPAARLLEDGSGRGVLDGAAALVLESAERAVERGARPWPRCPAPCGPPTPRRPSPRRCTRARPPRDCGSARPRTPERPPRWTSPLGSATARERSASSRPRRAWPTSPRAAPAPYWPPAAGERRTTRLPHWC